MGRQMAGVGLVEPVEREEPDTQAAKQQHQLQPQAEAVVLLHKQPQPHQPAPEVQRPQPQTKPLQPQHPQVQPRQPEAQAEAQAKAQAKAQAEAWWVGAINVFQRQPQLERQAKPEALHEERRQPHTLQQQTQEQPQQDAAPAEQPRQQEQPQQLQHRAWALLLPSEAAEGRGTQTKSETALIIVKRCAWTACHAVA